MRLAMVPYCARVGLVACAAALATAARAADWPQFRGADRDNISRETGLARSWPEGGPPVLWKTDVCQGYAAAAIVGGRVYFNDYDRTAKEWLVRCLNLEGGKELWRFKEAKTIRPNHGITRTVPAVTGKLVLSLDPKCVFHALDAATGREVWRLDLVEKYQAVIPDWYNGQNPLLDGDRVILGIGGADVLMVALDAASGSEVWRTPNPNKWPLAHASVMPATLAGVKQYLWCTLFGPLGVDAADGKLLWHHARKFNVAVAPSPLPLPGDRVFMSAGYDAGTVMVRVKKDGDRFATETVFELGPEEWNSEVHTPILWQDHLLAVGRKNRGLLTCLTLDGKAVWTSEGHASFGLGSYLLADGLLFVLEGDSGMLRLVEAGTTAYKELARAQVLSGGDVWGPMALSDGKLVLRDMTKMVCLDVRSATAIAPREREEARSRSASEGVGAFRLAADTAAPPADSGGAGSYRRARVATGENGGRLLDDLRGLAVDAAGQLYVAGDHKVLALGRAGARPAGTWATAGPAHCISIAADGTLYVGEEGRIEVFAPGTPDKPRATWTDAERFGRVTAIALIGERVIVADAAKPRILVCDLTGKTLATIGRETRRRFMLPNGVLDLVLDRAGHIRVCNPGQHRIEEYDLDGRFVDSIGRFDGQDPAGFSGCCNPTNIALTPGGDLVAVVKAPPGVKVFATDGRLLAAFGGDALDPNCKNSDVAVDAHGRIYVADPARGHVVIFEPAGAASPAETQPAAATQPGFANGVVQVRP